MIEIKGKYNTANVMIDEVDSATRGQIQDFVNNPSFGNSYIAIMPDCHKGSGSCIGFTMQMNDRIIPDVVGVDIGCLDKDTEFLTPTGWKSLLPRLDSSLFSLYLWEGGSITSIFGWRHRYSSLYRHKDILRSYAVGYCKGEALYVKPKKGQFAVMFEYCGIRWWNHFTCREFYDIFS